MLSLMRLNSVNSSSFQSGSGNDFRIQSARISARKHVTRIICALIYELMHNNVNNLGIDKRAIGRNAHNRISLAGTSSAKVTIQNILLRAAEATHSQTLTLGRDGVVLVVS